MQKYPVEGKVTPIEFKDEEAISFMSQHSIDLLQQINKTNLFVPVTTRAVYQYERILLFQKMIKPKYAITSNGGTILIDGKPDAEWNKLIRLKLSENSIPNEDLLKVFAKIRHEDWVEREFYIDELFYMFQVDRGRIVHTELVAFEIELLKLGWRSFLHGRKLYILPTALNKAFAVSHLQSKLDYEIHVAAGDSIMDYDMLVQADIGYSPKHGELFEKQGNDSKVKWLNENGTASSEELLRHLLAMCKKN